MSKRINVNPDHYKVAGRERPGDAIPRARGAKKADPANERTARWRERQHKRDKERAR
jgi:hypothetical protein